MSKQLAEQERPHELIVPLIVAPPGLAAEPAMPPLIASSGGEGVATSSQSGSEVASQSAGQSAPETAATSKEGSKKEGAEVPPPSTQPVIVFQFHRLRRPIPDCVRRQRLSRVHTLHLPERFANL